jgi:hypothetical protein
MENYDYEDMYDYHEEESEPSESTEDGQVYSSSSAKVVEPGTEHTGRWTREEHEAFLSALRQYGKEWKKVAARVKTRTGSFPFRSISVHTYSCNHDTYFSC